MIRLNDYIRGDYMDKYLRLQVSIFGEFKEFDLSQESMSKLYQVFLSDGMMPSIMKEFDVLSQNVINRPVFIAQNNSISFSIGTKRLDITSDLSAGENILQKEEFIKLAKNYINNFYQLFPIGASRVSFISERMLKLLEDQDTKAIGSEYMQMSNIFNNDKIFEWSTNSVSLDSWTINNKVEEVNLNVTTAMRKLSVTIENKTINKTGLILTQDLNTIAERTMARLNANDIVKFIETASSKSDIIQNMISGGV